MLEPSMTPSMIHVSPSKTALLVGLLGLLGSAGLAPAQTALPTEAARSPGAAGSAPAPAKAVTPRAASKPAATPQAQAQPTQAQPTQAQPTQAQPTQAQPVSSIQTGALPAPDFQTKEHLQKAGVKRCLPTVQAVGQATMAGSAQYAAVSTWNSKQPDNRFSVSMIGQQFGAGLNSLPNGLSGVFSVPTTEGNCDAASLQIIPTTDSCASVQAQILTKGKALGNLAGVPLLQNAANAQVMLLPAAGNGCVLVALSTVYAE
jgi:hypothetical protein